MKFEVVALYSVVKSIKSIFHSSSCKKRCMLGQHLRCLADLLQRGKPIGAGLLDKMAGSIIRYCLFPYLWEKSVSRKYHMEN